MIINGNIFSGSNVTIIQNGRVLVNGVGAGTLRKYDERKFEEASKVEKITINSTLAQVNVSVSDSSKVEVHFHGEANLDGQIKFVVKRILNEIKIKVQYDGNCYDGSLNLDVTVPKTLKAIVAKTMSAGVELKKGVSAQSVRIETNSGRVTTYATFTKAFISTMSGSVELYVEAKQNISLDISTMSGSISAEFEHVRDINISARTMTGRIRNQHKGDSYGYNANANISTMSGSIFIS